MIWMRSSGDHKLIFPKAKAAVATAVAIGTTVALAAPALAAKVPGHPLFHHA